MTRENPFRAPRAQSPMSNRELAFEDTPSFTDDERDAFVEYCLRAYRAAPVELADDVHARWGKGACDISFGGGSFFGWCHEPRGLTIEDAHLISDFAKTKPFRDELEAERWAFLSWGNNARWTWSGGLHPATLLTLEEYLRDVEGAPARVRANPAPAHARLPIPTPQEMRARYDAWTPTAIFPPHVDLSDDDFVLAGELMQAMYDEAPIAATYWVGLSAVHASNDREIAGLIMISNERGLSLEYAVTGDAHHATSNASLHLPSFRGQAGARKNAYDELAAAGWIVIPDTRKNAWAPPDRLFRRLGLARRFSAEYAQALGQSPKQPSEFVRIRNNPADGDDVAADVQKDVARFLASDKGPRRVVSRPRPPSSATIPIGAREALEDDVDDLPRAPPRAPRAPRPPRHTGDADLADVHLAATGDGGAVTRLATRYRRFIRKMAYAFLRGWSPDVSPRTLGPEADDVAAEVEQRVFVGTERAPPAIKRYVVAQNDASFTTWLGAITKNVARNHVRSEVRARAPVKSAKAQAVEAEALDDVLGFEEREARARVSRDQSRAVVEGMRKLQEERAGRSRGDRRRVGDAGDELEVLRLRQEGKSYKEMAAHLGVSVSAVMSRLYRARRALEEASGVELRGLVGDLREGLGGAVPSKRGRPRKNPDDGDYEPDLYFEDAGDVFDLLDAGLLPDDVAVEALLALAEHRPDALAA